MSEPPRLPLSDLLAEYSLHNDRRHIYVEGVCDQIIIQWILDALNIHNVVVYSIDSVDISAEDLRRHGLGSGHKNKLIVLARELNAARGSSTLKVACVVDADFDYLLDRIEDNPYLRYTDGTSFEMYSYSSEAVDRICRFALSCSLEPVKGALGQLSSILADIFAIRAANEKLGLCLKWLPYEKRCTVKPDGSLQFDRERFVRDYLSKNGRLDKLGDFEKCYRELRSLRLFDERQCIRGHDFVLLLGRYCRERAGWSPGKLKVEEVMRGLLRLVLEAEKLADEQLFRELGVTFA